VDKQCPLGWFTISHEPVAAAIDLAQTLRAAHDEWPDVVVDASAFEHHLRTLEDVATLRVGDLYLAFACAHRDPAALGHLETYCLRPMHGPLAKLGLAPVLIEETLQAVREELLVAPTPGEARILRYSGQGQLRGWFRSVVLRAGMRRAGAQRRDVEYSDALHAEPSDDLELTFMKKKYGAAFQRAFGRALAALPLDQRLLLKQRYSHKLGVVELGVMHGVGAGTISKRVTAARDRLVAEIRTAMVSELGLVAGEVTSVLRLIESQVEITFTEPAAPAP